MSLLLRTTRSVLQHARRLPATTFSTLTQVNQSPKSEMLHVKWNDGTSAEYDPLFLRDNCYCPECLHTTTKQRLLNCVQDIPIDVQGQAKVMSNENQVHVAWSDGHTSSFSSEWLQERKDLEKAERKLPQRQTWQNINFQDNIPTFNFEQVMSSSSYLEDYVHHLWQFGLVLLDNLPDEPGCVRRLANKVSPIGLRRTNYGDTFSVENKLDPNNMAYTDLGLALHSDLCYYKYKPGVQMLHCLEQAESGGNSTFVDSFQVVQDFQFINPKAYELLCKHSFTYVDIGTDEFGEFHLQCDRPLIEFDPDGTTLTSVNLNDHTRHSCMRLPMEEVHSLYQAYYEFCNHLNSPKYVIDHRLQGGQLVAFDNNRVLHGRRAFKVNANMGGTRRLEGGYVDWDDVLSRFRTLKSSAAL